MSTQAVEPATIDDLYRTEGKAELIGGRIVNFRASGFLPAQAAGNIYSSLREYAKRSRHGFAATDRLGFAVKELPSGRESFSPDAAFHAGPPPRNLMRFIEGPPTFAVEARSENDYGEMAENDMAEKRADYFAAGTLVVWDVDPEAETVAIYRSSSPTTPEFKRRGEVADAEPAAPGWNLAVDDIFAI
jgi:Uma2 family endonuclease